jgi:tetratricopeptide (TPR) repeat protein
MVLVLIILALLATAIFFRRPIETWAATQSCLRMSRDHYPNIASLEGAPDFESYMNSARLQCRAEVAYEWFEQAEETEDRQELGDKVIALYTELIESGAGGLAYRSQRASVYAALGEYERALADFNFLLLHDPENYWMLEQRGDLYVQMGRYAEALADFEALYERARQDPGSSDAYLARLEAQIEAIATEL